MFTISLSLNKNIENMKNIFHNDDTLQFKKFQTRTKTSSDFCMFFIDNMVNLNRIDRSILEPIMRLPQDTNIYNLNSFKKFIITSTSVEITNNSHEIINYILNGRVILFMEGDAHALVIDCEDYETRAIEEPQIEKTIIGPKEGFNESLITNISLIRRKLRTRELKFRLTTIGSVSNTNACICYIDGIADEKLLEEIITRVDNIKIDGVFDVKYIQELIDDNPMSIFETSGSTQKPDVLASKLLEGRIAILLDGTPTATTVPFLFIENFQSGQDYYINYYYASIIRLLRIMGFLITTGLPAIYLSLVTYHIEILPTPLLLSIFASRQEVPFPTVVELILLLIIFEILIEAGSRTPSYIGQALSIVGALVLGSSAVEARLVSSTMIILVATSSITGLMIPNLSGVSIILRVIFIFFSTIFGIYGYIFGMVGLLIHLFSLKSFAMPYMSTIVSVYGKDLKDTFFRGPRWYIERKKFGGKK